MKMDCTKLDCTKLDCPFCKRSTKGYASIKCSLCASQYHLECVTGDHVVPTTNCWRCWKCEATEQPIRSESVIRA